MAVANTLAYYNTATIMAAKSFKAQAHGVNFQRWGQCSNIFAPVKYNSHFHLKDILAKYLFCI